MEGGSPSSRHLPVTIHQQKPGHAAGPASHMWLHFESLEQPYPTACLAARGWHRPRQVTYPALAGVRAT